MKIARSVLTPLEGGGRDYDGLVERLGRSKVVLLGEASHGTHDFYAARAAITRRLIAEKGFDAVAVEADWPDAYRVNRYVRGESYDTSPDEALSGFKRFPTWMWRNNVVLDFVTWLEAHNQSNPEAQAGFYGLDLYSLFASIEAVIDYLGRVDPAAARRARDLYSCFEHYGEDSQAYGYAAAFGIDKHCEEEVIAQLVEMRGKAEEYEGRDGLLASEGFFQAEQNARLVKNAEEYYRTMFTGRVSSWNLRDEHMADTLDAIHRHLRARGRDGKIVVWAHNSHLGDARATEMGRRGELNLGQLARELYGRDMASVGFTTYSGTVTAASDWDGPAELKRVRPGLPGSWEEAFHALGIERFLLTLDDPALPADFRTTRLERAIGVIYRPETERQSHYFEAELAKQFDAVLHFDTTRALQPLEPYAEKSEEPPETYPTGI